MDEFSLIDRFFKSILSTRQDVVLGIGDDAACLHVPAGQQLLVSSDTLVDGVHFLSSWDPYDIASKAVRVNLSDIAAMGGEPAWITLALTLPTLDAVWLSRFAQGLNDTLTLFNVALVGGDTTRGPLSMTLTIHGLVDRGAAITRSGAKPGDALYVTGPLGAAACALTPDAMPESCRHTLLHALHHPMPRVDLAPLLRRHAAAAIDISDGLLADLAHLCVASGVGACVSLQAIPLHPSVLMFNPRKALDFALHGGDDYQLCVAVSPAQEKEWLASLAAMGAQAYRIGVCDALPGVRAEGLGVLSVRGYNHFGASDDDVAIT